MGAQQQKRALSAWFMHLPGEDESNCNFSNDRAREVLVAHTKNHHGNVIVLEQIDLEYISLVKPQII